MPPYPRGPHREDPRRRARPPTRRTAPPRQPVRRQHRLLPARAVLAGHLTDDLGRSAAAVGLVLGLRNLSRQGLFPIGGSAADRLGARGVIITGCGLRTLGFSLFALGDALPVLIAASLLSGLAGALFNPAVRTYVAQEAGDRKAEAFALFNVFATAGARPVRCWAAVCCCSAAAGRRR
ncbi:MFS transporter [Streptomyces sp. NPDC059835]|uniref:MFS transporter n=1 Tax=Streptomyces sp. NPDC059835 TaxID=3346967 RepID=UPI00365702D4